MCYSSQIAAAYRQHLKLTGATIDLDQFEEVFGFPTTLFFNAHVRLIDTRINQLSQATLMQRVASLRSASTPGDRSAAPTQHRETP